MASMRNRPTPCQLTVVLLSISTLTIVLLLHGWTAASEKVAQSDPQTAQDPSCPAVCNCTFIMRKHGVKKVLVDCKNKKLPSIPAGIPNNTQVLYLDGNSISKIQGELASLSHLEELHMVDNKLQKIDSGDLKGLGSLKLFYATRNQLPNWPDLCGDVGSSLTHLGIDGNKLKGDPAPQSYAKCTALQSLILTKNEFPRLTNATLAALGSAGALKSVKINSVKMSGMNATALVPLTHQLTNLDLSDNPKLPVEQLVAAFNAASFTDKFVGLTLKSSGWTKLPKGFLPKGHFPSLDILHLDDSSELSSIDPDALTGGSSLTQLFLNTCPLTSLDSQLAGLTKLRKISLAKSRLTKWTSATFSQASLREIDLSDAGVVTIGGRDGISENPLPNLASMNDAGLRIGGNPLVCNCSLLWLTKQLANDTIKKKFYKPEKVMCHDEASGTYLPLTSCKPVNCSSSTTTTPAITTTTTSSSTRTTTSTAVTTTLTTPKPTKPPVTGTTRGPTEAPGIPTSANQPAWFLPVLISGVIVGAALLIVGSALLVRRYRQRRTDGLSEQRRHLVGEDPDDGSDGGGGGGGLGSDCFRLTSRRARQDRGGAAASASAAGAEYTAVDAEA